TGAGGEGVLLAQNNTLKGFNISSTVASADGIEDGGGSVGSLTISSVSISGTGQAVDIDQGGNLNVTLDSLSSSGSSEQGVQLAGGRAPRSPRLPPPLPAAFRARRGRPSWSATAPAPPAPAAPSPSPSGARSAAPARSAPSTSRTARRAPAA